jgi:hypothetical protein
MRKRCIIKTASKRLVMFKRVVENLLKFTEKVLAATRIGFTQLFDCCQTVSASLLGLF